MNKGIRIKKNDVLWFSYPVPLSQERKNEMINDLIKQQETGIVLVHGLELLLVGKRNKHIKIV